MPSVKATAPAALSRPISVISSPLRPLVSAAIGVHMHDARCRGRGAWTKSTMVGSSIAGSVSGWQMMVVTPPAAAAWLAEAMRLAVLGAGLADEGAHVDQAGRDDVAAAIDDLGAFRHAGRADAALGLADRAVGDQHVAGKIEVARRIDDPRVGEQDRAAVAAIDQHGHAFGRLRDSASSTAMRTATPISTCSRISDCAPSATIGVDLDAAVHRAGMHHQRVGLGVGELLLVEAEIVEILLRRGHERAVHALALQAQHHHDVGAVRALRACRA